MIASLGPLNVSGLIHNIIPLTLGNISGGTVMLAMTYYLVYIYGRDKDASIDS